MKQKTRQQAILNTLLRHGYVSIDSLAREIGVSSQTIRRDINLMDQTGILERKPGGAIPRTRNTLNSTYSSRQLEDQKEKYAIARAVTAYIPDNCSVFMTLGTTLETVATCLTERSGLMVVTNNTIAALTLNRKSDFEVILASGYMRKSSNGLVGASTLEFVNGFHCDYLLTSAGGIHEEDGTILDYHSADVSICQKMMANARKKILAVSNAKFSRRAVIRVAPLSAVDVLITYDPCPRLRELADKAEVECIDAAD